MTKTRIMLAEHHALMRDGLRLLIDSQPEMEVVAEVGNGEDAWRVAHDIRPDIILLDIEISEITGEQVVRYLLKSHPKIKVLIISHSLDEARQNQMRTWGVAGYVTEQVNAQQLADAIRQIMAGERVFTNLETKVDEDSTYVASSKELKLKEKEVTVAKLVARGYTNIEIAQSMNVSIKSIEAHKTHINQKLGFKTRSDLVAYAQEQGWFFDI